VAAFKAQNPRPKELERAWQFYQNALHVARTVSPTPPAAMAETSNTAASSSNQLGKTPSPKPFL
jgi:hypothetical protein